MSLSSLVLSQFRIKNKKKNRTRFPRHLYTRGASDDSRFLFMNLGLVINSSLSWKNRISNAIGNHNSQSCVPTYLTSTLIYRIELLGQLEKLPKLDYQFCIAVVRYWNRTNFKSLIKNVSQF